MDCKEAARLYDAALAAYLEGREGCEILAIYYLWHKRKTCKTATLGNA